MDDILTIAQIEAHYALESILVEDPQTNEALEVLSGKVRWPSKDRDEVYRQAIALRPRRFAILYAGKMPEGTEIVLSSSMRFRRLVQLASVCVFMLCVMDSLAAIAAPAAPWQVAEGPLLTRWAHSVNPDKVHPEYPRPQLVRAKWQSLNGLWDYAITARGEERPNTYAGHILVPFPVESALSGVMQPVSPDQRLWYRRTFQVPDDWAGQRLLLHFGAVDWECEVFVNGQKVGQHQGGYDPFTFDITQALRDSAAQELIVAVWDPTDAGFQPRGKQVRQPHGIWYTAVTGIWQSVWIEPVASAHIRGTRIVPDIDNRQVHITVLASDAAQDTRVQISITGVSTADKRGAVSAETITAAAGKDVAIPLNPLYLWSPGEPWLYDFQIQLLDASGRVLDGADSYFGMRKIEVRKDPSGLNRLLLNNEPLFHFGPLDQGWWPDGLYTAPTDEALRYDIQIMRRLGYNMCRKHVKIEPLRWYYWCDRLGLMVWQDMPSGDRYIRPDETDIQRSAESEKVFRRELEALIRTRFNHPSIVAWVPFNEGWGQFKTNEILSWIKTQDPTRLVDGPSGWTDRGEGDMHDVHRYPGPGMPPVEEGRAAVLGEFGGLGLPISGHLWKDRDNWGYRTYSSREELADAYRQLIEQLPPLIAQGLAAAVYTQTTDVEIEVNGIMTYDRAIVKLPNSVAQLHQRLYEPPPQIRTIVPTSLPHKQSWRYTTEQPGDTWYQRDADDSRWSEGPGGFGTEGTPGASIGTVWNTPEIWLRRSFDGTGQVPGRHYLHIHHDEDAEVYINGVLACRLSGYTVDYVMVPVSDEARAALRPGSNTMAVHCRQTTGGQYIDVGLVAVEER